MPNDVDITIGADTTRFRTGLSEMRAEMAKTTESFRQLSTSNIFGAFSVGAIVSFAKEIFTTAGRIEDLSERFGVGTVFLQQWGGAAEEAGSSMEGVGQAMNKLIVSISKADQGNKETIKDFQALGVSVEDLRSLSAEQIWNKISHSSLEAKNMVGIFGRSALDLVPVFTAVTSGATKLGEAMDDSVIKKLDAGGDAIARVSQRAQVQGGNLLAWLISVGEKAKYLSPIALIEEHLLGDSQAPQGTAGRAQRKKLPIPEPETVVPERDAGSVAARQESLRDRLTKLDEEHAARQRTNQEQLNYLLEQRNEIMLHGGETSKTEEGALQTRITLAENENAIDGARAKIATEQAATDKQITVEREHAAEQAEREADARDKAAAAAAQDLADSRERTAELQQELSGHEDIAAQLKIAYDFDLKINEARREGNNQLAAQLEKEKSLSLELEKQAAAQKAEAEATATDDARRKHISEANQSLANNIQGNLNALMQSAGYQTLARRFGSAAALQALIPGSNAGVVATDPVTGRLDVGSLAKILEMQQRDLHFGRNPSFSEQVMIDARTRALVSDQAPLVQNPITGAYEIGGGQYFQQILEGLRRANRQLQATHQAIAPLPGG